MTQIWVHQLSVCLFVCLSFFLSLSPNLHRILSFGLSIYLSRCLYISICFLLTCIIIRHHLVFLSVCLSLLFSLASYIILFVVSTNPLFTWNTSNGLTLQFYCLSVFVCFLILMVISFFVCFYMFYLSFFDYLLVILAIAFI
jgi:hypothetical protein